MADISGNVIAIDALELYLNKQGIGVAHRRAAVDRARQNACGFGGKVFPLTTLDAVLADSVEAERCRRTVLSGEYIRITQQVIAGG